jgi:oligopeptidase A
METNPLLATGRLPEFSAIKPEHIEPALMDTLNANRQRLEALLADAEGQVPDIAATILPFEELGDRLGRVWGPVGHLHAVMNSPELREVYNRCLPALSRYQTEIAQDTRLCRLYQRVAETLSDDEANSGATSVISHALRDFHLAGVDLPDDKKQRFKAAIEELTQLGARFEQNVLDSMAAWSYHEADEAQLAGLPAWAMEQAAQNAREKSLDGWLFRLDQPTYVDIVTHAENRDLRRRFYRAWMTRASNQADFHNGSPSDGHSDGDADFDNTSVIERILELRHEVAELVGFDHYASYSLASKMADSVTDVIGFLTDLAEKSRATAREELAELERFAGESLSAWDIAFWSEKLREERYSVSDEQLRPYLPLDRVLKGMFEVMRKLYGLTVRQVDGVDVWHDDVRYFELVQADGNIIGGFYTDLFARPDKRSGAWMDECICRKDIKGQLALPVAHLVCNFAAPIGSAPSLLTHNDVLTLFHEFGHTLHHLLTRVDYPSVSGINGVPWDAVELPSQFMENFAWEPDVLRMLSGHHESGKPLPDELLGKLQASRTFHAGLHMVRQIEFAIFDLRLHAEYSQRTGNDIYALLDEIRQQVAVIEQPDFSRFAHAFSHIFAGGYAAGYYSYKWAEVLAADAWSAFKECGIFDPDVAERFRAEILEIGGTRKISDAFVAFRGRPPRIEPLLAQSGIAGEAP